MGTDQLEIKAALQIGKTVSEVFEAIVDPEKMSNYFLSKGSNRIQEGLTIYWEFPEFEGSYPVHIKSVKKDEYIAFSWEGAEGNELLVEMYFEPRNEEATLLSITEKSMPNNQEGINWLKRNTEGWANFLACLKAYLEFGINLRKGGFDFMIEN